MTQLESGSLVSFPDAAEVRIVLPRHETQGVGMAVVGETATLYIAGRVARKEIRRETARSFRETLRLFTRHVGADKEVSTITRHDIERWLATMDVAPATLQLRFSTLRTFLRWCILEGHCPRDPTAGIKAARRPRRVPRHLRTSDVAAALKAAPDSRERLIIMLMVGEGLRAGEVASLQIADVDRSRMTITVTGKGGHMRTLPLTEDADQAMAEYLLSRGRGAGHLIRSYKRSYAAEHDGLSAKYVARMAGAAVRRSGAEESGHALRHTFARDFLDEGGDLLALKDALGHASIQTTQIYTPLAAVSSLRQVMGRKRYGSDPEAA